MDQVTLPRQALVIAGGEFLFQEERIRVPSFVIFGIQVIKGVRLTLGQG